HIDNANIEIITKLLTFIILYFSFLSIKYLKDKKQILDK
ncbi:hypothetical protein, partial [Streptobacillus felis]